VAITGRRRLRATAEMDQASTLSAPTAQSKDHQERTPTDIILS
jgi:hypothetical protein